MGWWVKDHIAVNDDETKQLCSIEADAQASLPAADQSGTAGFIIVRGSSALVLATGDTYIMNSAGTWVQQPSGVQLDLTGYATTQDLNNGLAGKVDTTTYTAGQAAQDAVIGTKVSSADVFGAGTLIPDNADLNDYTTGGKYYGGNSAGNSVLNLPVANGSFTFSLEVKLPTPSMIYQYLRVCRLADDPYIYCRRRYNAWGAWYKFDGTMV